MSKHDIFVEILKIGSPYAFGIAVGALFFGLVVAALTRIWKI
jgi:uncharacterized protein (DUF2062 family)